jgi:hypothetical protein
MYANKSSEIKKYHLNANECKGNKKKEKVVIIKRKKKKK